MSKTITQANLNANADKTYGINEFRSMVNYVNPKNKGYVRFSKGADGKLAIQKINNKIDVPLSWRSNVRAEHNKAIRETFARAMSADLKYMGAKADEIKNMILRPVVGDNRVDEGKALSRLDVKAVFEKFDKEFNTTTGRLRILDNFINEAMLKTGYTGGDKEEFLKDYLQCQKMEIDPKFLDYITMREEKDLTPEEISAGGLEKLAPDKRMLKSEVEFRSLICRLDALVADATLRVKTVHACKNLARALVANPNAFSDGHLPAEDLAIVRASLGSLLAKDGVSEVDLGVKVGGGNAGLETFIGTVLPAMIRQAVENVLDFADTKNPESVEQTLDADLNVDTILDMAKRFMKGAKAAVDKVSLQNPGAAGNGQKGANGLLSKLDEVMSTYCKIEVRGVAIQAVKSIAFRERGVATRLVGEMQRELTEPIVKEIALENYAVDFITENFGKVENPGDKTGVDRNGLPAHGAVAEKAKDTINNVKIAAQLVWGEMLFKPGAGGAEVPVLGGSAGKFVDKMEDKAAELANGQKGGMRLYKNLLGGTLVNIVNAKIRNAKEGGIGTNVKVSEDDYPAAFDQLEAASKAWRKFTDDKKDVIVAKARSGFLAQLNRLVKKGNITADDKATLIADFDLRLDEAVKRAEERFFREKTPLSIDGDKNEMVKRGAEILANLVNEEKADVVNDMKRRIGLTIVASKTSTAVSRDILDVRAHVMDCLDTLAKDKYEFKGNPDKTSVNLALTKLYYSVMESKFEDKSVDPKKADAGFVRKLQSDFADAAKKFVTNYNKAVDIIDKQALKLAKSNIENELFEHRDFVMYKNELKKDEFKAMVDSMAVDLVMARKHKIDAMKRLFLEHPETYSKKQITDDTTDQQLFPTMGSDYTKTDENRFHVYARIVIARGKSVEEWIAHPNGKDSPNNLATELQTNTVRIVSEESGTKISAAAKSLPKNELHNIVNVAIKQVLANVNKFALSYASGGRKAFLARVEREVRELVESRVAAYAAFRGEFVPLAQKAMAKYPALGQENLDAKLNSVLDATSRETAFPKAKTFAIAFDGMLAKMVKDHIDMQTDEFLRYSAKVTEAYEKCVKIFNERVSAKEAELAANGATEEDLAYMREKLMPVFRDKLEADILQNPDSYLRVDNENHVDFGVKLAELAADSAIRNMAYALKDMNLATDIGKTMVLRAIGLGEFAYDSSTRDIANETIQTWLKGTDARKLYAGARQAEMTRAAYGEAATGAAVDEAKAKIAAFRNSLREHLVGIRNAVLEGEFNISQVNPAVALFKSWLAKYNLPKIEANSKDYGYGTLEELAIAHFKTRIITLQRKIAESDGEGTAGEALLSPQYVTELVQFINNIGLKAYIASRQNEIVKTRWDEIAGRGENMSLYDLTVEGDLSQELRDMRHLNNVGLTAILTNALDQAEKVVRQKVSTMEDISRWGEMIEKEFANAVADNSNHIVDFEVFARRRIAMMSVIDYISNDRNMDRYVDAALKNYFKVDILAEGALKPKYAAKHAADVKFFVDELKKTARAQAADAVKRLKDDAYSIPKPGEFLPNLPANGVDDGNGGKYNLLTNVFTSIAEGLVKAVSTMKKAPLGIMLAEISKNLAK